MRSTVGVGTTFSVDLPVLVADREGTPAQPTVTEVHQ